MRYSLSIFLLMLVILVFGAILIQDFKCVDCCKYPECKWCTPDDIKKYYNNGTVEYQCINYSEVYYYSEDNMSLIDKTTCMIANRGI